MENSKFDVYTHRGWFMVCPVFLGFADDEVWMQERHWCLRPLMWLAEVMSQGMNFVLSVMDDDFEPGFLISHVVELEAPIRATDLDA